MLYTNLALALLFQNKFDYAKAVYLLYAEQAFDSSRSFKELFFEDFKSLAKEGLTHPDIEKIKTLLQ